MHHVRIIPAFQIHLFPYCTPLLLLRRVNINYGQRDYIKGRKTFEIQPLQSSTLSGPEQRQIAIFVRHPPKRGFVSCAFWLDVELGR
jgi:hypothetical protein